MRADSDVKELIQKVNGGELNKYLADLDGTHFGLYLPTYDDGDSVKMMLQGYSQTERNLKVFVSKDSDNAIEGAKMVAWMGGQNAKDSKCAHGGTAKCRHCTAHGSHCRHCTHKSGRTVGDLIAPELNYDDAILKLDDKRHLLEPLASDQFGLTLLHGHNDQYMFTHLPEGQVSVISNGTTSFRKEEDVLNDPTFVPNVWRASQGRFRVAGGHSLITETE